MSDRTFRWGVLGTGNIARQFSRDVQGLPDHEIAQVASRSANRAMAFAKEFGGTAADGYEELFDDPGLDGIYISLPNTMHAEWTIRALKARHAVLCEKPLATSVPEAEEMFAAADKARRPLVEAFMYRTHPQTQAVLEAIRSGAIGRVTHIRTSFCYRTNTIEGNIRFDPALAGGALMDVGCYCLDFTMLMGDAAVKQANVISRRHDRGVDVMTSGVLELENGVQATFMCGMDTQADNTAVINGTDGYITVAVPWKPRDDAGYTIARGAKPKQDLKPDESATAPPPEFVATPATVPLYGKEAQAFAAVVRGEAEPFMPKDHSLRLARLLDAMRRAAS